MPQNESQIKTWKAYAFDIVSNVLLAIVGFNCTQINSQMKEMGDHFVKSDARIAEIEISRKEKLGAYEKLLDSVDEMRIQLAKLSVKMDTKLR